MVNVNDTNGTWQYNTGSGWTAFGAVSSTSAVLLDPSALVRFVPNAGFNAANISFTFRAWDHTAGTARCATGLDAPALVGITPSSVRFARAPAVSWCARAIPTRRSMSAVLRG